MLRVDGAGRTPSTSSAPAATARGSLQHLDRLACRRRRLPACRWPSTATAALSSQVRARPTCCTALGVKHRPAARTRSAHCIAEAGVGFMFAPAHHAGHAPRRPDARVELGTRTIFNLLGPLANPAGVNAPAGRRVLARMGGAAGRDAEGRSAPRQVWVVHGDGLDEITTTGATMSSPSLRERRDSQLHRHARGRSACAADARGAQRGGDAAFNAGALRAVLRRRPALIATRC